jgi:hypothetical protein
VTNVPPGVRNSVASLRDESTSSTWVKASCTQADPTLGAPSWRTLGVAGALDQHGLPRRTEMSSTHTSAFQSLTSALMLLLHLSLVMSSTSVIHLGMGLMATKSTPMMILLAGMCLAATCSHPPGAAQRSITQRAPERKSYFLLSWISLNAERARYPCSLRA